MRRERSWLDREEVEMIDAVGAESGIDMCVKCAVRGGRKSFVEC